MDVKREHPGRVKALAVLGTAAVCVIAGAIVGAMAFPIGHAGPAAASAAPAGVLPSRAAIPASLPSASGKAFCQSTPAAPALPVPGSASGKLSAKGGGGAVSVSASSSKGATICAKAPSLPGGATAAALPTAKAPSAPSLPKLPVPAAARASARPASHPSSKPSSKSSKGKPAKGGTSTTKCVSTPAVPSSVPVSGGLKVCVSLPPMPKLPIPTPKLPPLPGVVASVLPSTGLSVPSVL